MDALTGIKDDVRFNHEAADALAGEFRASAKLLRSQANGREKLATRPGFGPRLGGFYGWPYYGYPYFVGRRYRPFYHGAFYDPFWSSPFDYPEVYSYTIYNSFVDMKITRAGTNDSVFEGRAEANTRSDDLTKLVPNLVTAMFTNFPGRSGERVRVNVPLDKQRS